MADNEVLDDANYEAQLAAMKAAGTLDMWTARTVYQMSKSMGNSYSKRQSTVVSITTSIVTAIVAFLSAKFSIGGD